MTGSPSLARVQWPNQNALRRYPFSITATHISTDGNLQLPTATFVDARISTFWEARLHFAGFYLARLQFTRTSFRVDIGHRSVGEYVATASGAIDSKEHIGHALVGTGVLAGTQGSIVTGDLAYLAGMTPGEYFFDTFSAGFDPGVIYVQPKTLRSLVIDNNGSESTELSGVVRLRASNNTQFRVLQENNENVVVFDAIGTPDLKEECACESSSSQPVLTVGGLPPNEAGAVDIFGSRCMEITPQAAGLRLANSCAEPCCDCGEDTGVDARLDLLYTQITTMESRLGALENAFARLGELTDAQLSCDELQCQPYDADSDGAIIDNFELGQ